MTKEEKVANYAEIDYLLGYNQAMEDYKVQEVKEILKGIIERYDPYEDNFVSIFQHNIDEINGILNSLPND